MKDSEKKVYAVKVENDSKINKKGFNDVLINLTKFHAITDGNILDYSIAKHVEKKVELNKVTGKNLDRMEVVNLDKVELAHVKRKLQREGVDFQIIRNKDTKECTILFAAKDEKKLNNAVEKVAKDNEHNREKMSLRERKEIAQEKQREYEALRKQKEKKLSREGMEL